MQAIDYQESAALTRDAGHVLSGNSTTQPKRLQQLVDDATSTDEAVENSASETLWCSPHCVPERQKQEALF